MDAQPLANAIRAALPAHLTAQAEPLASILVRLQSGDLPPAEAAAQLARSTIAPALAALADKVVEAPGSPLRFGPIIAGGAGTVQQITVGNGGSVTGGIVGTQINVTLTAPPPGGSAPPPPALLVGRVDDLAALRSRLGIDTGGAEAAPIQVLTAIRGWPGVGKTTIAAALAHDPAVAAAFPDGVLWASLGQEPHTLAELAAWGRALGIDDLIRETVEGASARLTAALRDRRTLLIIDDVWEPAHALPFKVGGRGCATLLTTRINQVADALAPTPDAVYRLSVLTDESAMELLRTLAPAVVAGHPDACRELVRELEGLPLALQVAGRLLQTEASLGFGVQDLLAELREGARLLEALAPADRSDLANETTPTVAVLLQKSTGRLDAETRDRFAYLGAFAPKPATFDLAALQGVWEMPDARPTVRELVGRGLLEPVGEGRFWMHALLVSHAISLCDP